jgi:hypothetical protein
MNEAIEKSIYHTSAEFGAARAVKTLNFSARTSAGRPRSGQNANRTCFDQLLRAESTIQCRNQFRSKERDA